MNQSEQVMYFTVLVYRVLGKIVGLVPL